MGFSAGKGIAEGQCSSGFLTPDQLTALLTGNVVHKNVFGRQWLFPGMTFSCEGAISKWIIGAEWVGGGTRYPEMQIWRLIDPPIGSEDTYEVIERVELRITEVSPNGMYEYTVDPPMPFRAGDVVGVFEPSSGESRIQLYFKEGQGSTIYYAFRDQPLSLFSPTAVFNEITSPLIAVEIGKIVILHILNIFCCQYSLSLSTSFNLSSFKFSGHNRTGWTRRDCH